MIAAFEEVRKKHDPVKLKEQWDQIAVRPILIDDEEYPALLREIYSPPQVLFIKGKMSTFQKPAIAIVGARKCTAYGRQASEKLASELAGLGICVISGGARGIDTAAHRGALQTGETIAVFGCGVDVSYPPENRELFSQIESAGALISEYPPGTPPIAGNFPARNRIISGLSKGVLVVEAAEKSGSLITAHLALEQNREVFAIPGGILSPLSRGTNRLIQQGAKLVMEGADLLEEFGLEASPKSAKAELPILSAPEQQILSQLSPETSKSLEELVNQTGLEWSAASLILFEMELKGWVKNEGLQGYIRLLL